MALNNGFIDAYEMRWLNYALLSGGALSGVDLNGIGFSEAMLKLKS